MSPYILKLERSDLDPIVAEMGKKIDAPGKLAYILFAWFKRYVERGFFRFALYVGVIVLTLFEIWWRLIRNYEDEKIADGLHGDVE
jgi:hypothetical protein